MKVVFPDGVLYQTLDGESVLLNLGSEQYFGLDEVGTCMWSILRETESVEAAFQRLLAVYDVEPEQLRSDLDELISQLAEHGLLEIIEA